MGIWPHRQASGDRVISVNCEQRDAAGVPEPGLSSERELRGLAACVRAYARPDAKRSSVQLAVTAGVFILLWLAMWLTLDHDLGYWLTLLLAVPTAGFLIRFFIIQHDCGHGSYFRSRRANNLLGRALGVLTLTPYDYWRRAHALHHATSGNLDRRGVGDIETKTVREYRALPRWQRTAYRLYRHPLVMFGIGPTYVFILKHRLPFDLPLLHRGLWVSILATNLAIAGLFALLAMIVGPLELLMIQLPITLMAASIGVWMFFVQHQYEDAYWRPEADWSFYQAGLSGSSHYILPRPLQWLTASIGLHHIHHLCSRVPNYRLQECLEQVPGLEQARRLTLIDSLKCARLALWDEERGRMVGFRETKRNEA